MKCCSKCKEVKNLIEFNKCKSTKDGFHNYCRSCSKSHFSSWVKAPVVDVKVGEKYCRSCGTTKLIKYFPKNKNGVLGLHSKCRPCIASAIKLRKENNPEYYQQLKEIARQYTIDNREKANIKSAKRRANRIGTTPLWVSKEYEEFFLSEIYHLATLREEATRFNFYLYRCRA